MIPMPSMRTLAAMLVGILYGLCVLFFNLWRSEVEDFADYQAKVIAAAKAQADKTDQVIKDQKQITEDTTNAWKAALDLTRSRYAGADGVRKYASGGAMPAVSGAACRVDDAGQDSIPAAGVLAEACAETTVTLNYLQDWVQTQKAAQ